MFNSLVKTNKEFHQSKVYSWYTDLHAKDVASKHLKTIGSVKIGCMPKVFGVPELLLWCEKHFNASKRTIQVGDNTIPPISLGPIVF